MKELSIEEKAKRYDEAIKKAKSKIKNDKDHVLYEEDILDIFPSLKESEDERIRNFLVDFIKVCAWTEKTDQGWPTKDACIAWIEKQCEHANFRNKIQVGDKVTRNEDGVLVNLSQLNRVSKKQGEQKPAEWTRKAVVDALTDELTARITPLHKKALAGTITDKEDMYRAAFLEMRSFVNSPSFKIGKSAEWSKDDEYYRNIILYILNNECVGKTDKENAVKWFKSLRPQNTWFPSDEQLNSLKQAINAFPYETDYLELLYDDLKKLKGE